MEIREEKTTVIVRLMVANPVIYAYEQVGKQLDILIV